MLECCISLFYALESKQRKKPMKSRIKVNYLDGLTFDLHTNQRQMQLCMSNYPLYNVKECLIL